MVTVAEAEQTLAERRGIVTKTEETLRAQEQPPITQRQLRMGAARTRVGRVRLAALFQKAKAIALGKVEREKQALTVYEGQVGEAKVYDKESIHEKLREEIEIATVKYQDAVNRDDDERAAMLDSRLAHLKQAVPKVEEGYTYQQALGWVGAWVDYDMARREEKQAYIQKIRKREAEFEEEGIIVEREVPKYSPQVLGMGQMPADVTAVMGRVTELRVPDKVIEGEKYTDVVLSPTEVPGEFRYSKLVHEETGTPITISETGEVTYPEPSVIDISPEQTFAQEAIGKIRETKFGKVLDWLADAPIGMYPELYREDEKIKAEWKVLTPGEIAGGIVGFGETVAPHIKKGWEEIGGVTIYDVTAPPLAQTIIGYPDVSLAGAIHKLPEAKTTGVFEALADVPMVVPFTRLDIEDVGVYGKITGLGPPKLSTVGDVSRDVFGKIKTGTGWVAEQWTGLGKAISEKVVPIKEGVVYGTKAYQEKWLLDKEFRKKELFRQEAIAKGIGFPGKLTYPVALVAGFMATPWAAPAYFGADILAAGADIRDVGRLASEQLKKERTAYEKLRKETTVPLGYELSPKLTKAEWDKRLGEIKSTLTAQAKRRVGMDVTFLGVIGAAKAIHYIKQPVIKYRQWDIATKKYITDIKKMGYKPIVTQEVQRGVKGTFRTVQYKAPIEVFKTTRLKEFLKIKPKWVISQKAQIQVLRPWRGRYVKTDVKGYFAEAYKVRKVPSIKLTHKEILTITEKGRFAGFATKPHGIKKIFYVKPQYLPKVQVSKLTKVQKYVWGERATLPTAKQYMVRTIQFKPITVKPLKEYYIASTYGKSRFRPRAIFYRTAKDVTGFTFMKSRATGKILKDITEVTRFPEISKTQINWIKGKAGQVTLFEKSPIQIYKTVTPQKLAVLKSIVKPPLIPDVTTFPTPAMWGRVGAGAVAIIPSEIYMSPTGVSFVKTAEKVVTIPDVTTTPGVTTTTGQVPYSGITQIPTQIPVQIPTQIPAQIPAQIPTQIPAQVPRQIPRQAQVQRQVQRQVSIQKQISRAPPKTPVPTIPILPGKIPRGRRKRKPFVQVKPVTYTPYVKRYQKWIPVSKPKKKKKKAIEIGVRALRRTLAASLQIRAKGVPIPFAEPTKTEFRLSKESPLILVQRAPRRLKARTEVREIISIRRRRRKDSPSYL